MKKIFSVLLLGASLMLFNACGFEIIDAGNRGVITDMGAVEEKSYEEGLHFYNPISKTMHEIETKSETYNLHIDCYTKDIQSAKIKVTFMAAPDRANVYKLYRDFGSYGWVEKLANPIIEGSVKTVIGKWDAVDLVSNRQKAKEEIQKLISDNFKDKYLHINNIELNNISYSDDFEKAIENKVKAIQSAIEAQNRTVEVREEATQKLISAKAEAEAMRIQAQALAQNKGLVEYEAVKKWDGKLPEYMMGNSVPFINLNTGKQQYEN